MSKKIKQKIDFLIMEVLRLDRMLLDQKCVEAIAVEPEIVGMKKELIALIARRRKERGTLNKENAAFYCGISPETLDRYRKSGKLGYSQIGTRIVYTKALLDEFLDRCTIRAAVETTRRENMEVAKAMEGICGYRDT